MVSYAQNAEDVVLARALGDRTPGFYVDVGAADPVRHSVTKHFYDLGWRGVNVEPVPSSFEALRAARERDVNLGCAIGSEPGTLPLAVVDGTESLSTLDPGIAERHRADGWSTAVVEVEVVPLDAVLEEHAADRPIDFLKVDVEGREADVLASVDLGRWRPSALVVESTEPNTTVASHAGWEPLVLAAGYELALFDGLNRFYAHAGEPDVAERLAVPANVFDRWVPYALWRWLDPEARARVAAETPG
ncbi:MAG TPA: FkbM family methyltransferase [Thermoleophilaceae bacterium]|jgi:FkbM family methyltransferase